MKLTIVEGSVEEVIDYLRDAGVVVPVAQPSVTAVPNWEPNQAAVERWAGEAIGRTLMFRNKENNARSHSCVCVGWKQHHHGVYLLCEHDGYQNRPFPDKVMQRAS